MHDGYRLYKISIFIRRKIGFVIEISNNCTISSYNYESGEKYFCMQNLMREITNQCQLQMDSAYIYKHIFNESHSKMVQNLNLNVTRKCNNTKHLFDLVCSVINTTTELSFVWGGKVQVQQFAFFLSH